MKVKKRTSKLSGKKAHPVLTVLAETLTLDRANIMFLKIALLSLLFE